MTPWRAQARQHLISRGDAAINIKIADLMAKRVITAQPHHSVDHLRGLMARNRIHALPIVGPEGEALGLVTTADLAARKIHHAVVTHEKKVVGMISSFDLLKLVEDHRFVMKNPPDAGRTGARKALAP